MLAVRTPQPGRWIPLDNPESPADDLRKRGAALGCALFARGEGIWYSNGALFFACTSGGAAKLGQIFRLRPGRSGKADELDLYYEPTTPTGLNYGDNLTVAPGGCLIVCEDQYTDTVDNHVRVITPKGASFPLARLRIQTESAGACFSPDGQILFINIYSPTKTLAISGPWQKLLKA
jgi:secreted PhoX family phosphatase